MAGEGRAKAPPKFSGSGGKDSSMRNFSASFSDGKMKESSKKTWRNDMMKWKPSTSKAMVGFARQSQLVETNSRWFSFATITSFAGIFVAVYISETRYSIFKAGSEDPSWPYIEDLLKFLILLLTVASVFGILMYYHGMVLLFEIRGMYFAPHLPVWSRFHLAGLFWSCLGEVLIQLIFPYPLISRGEIQVWDSVLGHYSHYSTVDCLTLCMFLRLALLPRFLCSFHDLNAEDARVYARLVNLRVDTPLIVKVLLNDSGLALSIVWAVSVSVFAYFLFIFERGDSEQESVYSLAKYRNCLWLIIITMTTVGYGDVFPQTRMGRITTVAACFFAVVAFALTVNWSLKVLSLSRNEVTFHRVMKRVRASKAVARASVRLIEAVYVRSPLKARLDQARQETALGAKGGYQSLGGDWASGDATPVAPLGVGGFQQAEQRAQELSYMRRGRAVPRGKAFNSTGRQGVARFLASEELSTLRGVLNDTGVMKRISLFRKARAYLSFTNNVQHADETEQVARLQETHGRVRQQVMKLRGCVKELASFAELPPPQPPLRVV